MQDAFTSFIGQYGYLAIFLLIFVENVFPPIPSEAVLLFGGFMATKSGMSVWLVIAAATLGSLCGAGVLYALGRVLKRSRIEKLLEGRLGKLTRIKPEHVRKAEKWFERYEYKAVLICRCIPIVRSLISVPAGMAEMKPLPFFVLTAIGSAAWNTLLAWTGYLTGDAWETSLKYFGWYSTLAVAILCLLAVAFVIWLIKKRKKVNKTDVI